MASFVADEAVWKPEDWKWDAHNLKAMPVEAQSPAQTPGGKSAKSQKGDDAKQGCQVKAAAAHHWRIQKRQREWAAKNWSRHAAFLHPHSPPHAPDLRPGGGMHD